MSKRIDYIIDDIKEQYLENDNNIPWIIGFSGGKDSTVVLTLVWRALLAIRKELGNIALTRQVYVVNNDTLVENPIITDYIVEVMDKIQSAAIDQKLPINVQTTVPKLEDSFWISFLAYIIHSGFISGYQNRYGDNLKPPTNVYHRMTA